MSEYVCVHIYFRMCVFSITTPNQMLAKTKNLELYKYRICRYYLKILMKIRQIGCNRNTKNKRKTLRPMSVNSCMCILTHLDIKKNNKICMHFRQNKNM